MNNYNTALTTLASLIDHKKFQEFIDVSSNVCLFLYIVNLIYFFRQHQKKEN